MALQVQINLCSPGSVDRQSPGLLAHHVDVEHVLVPEVGLGGQDPGDGEVDQQVNATVSSRREYNLPGDAERVDGPLLHYHGLNEDIKA